MRKYFLLFIFIIFATACGKIELNPKQETVGDFQFVFDREITSETRSELRTFVGKQNKKFEKWLGPNGDELIVDNTGQLIQRKARIFIEDHKPKAPIQRDDPNTPENERKTKKVCGLTFLPVQTIIWEKCFWKENGGGYELEHYYICRIWERNGRIKVCNSRNYDEKESIEWREKHNI